MEKRGEGRGREKGGRERERGEVGRRKLGIGREGKGIMARWEGREKEMIKLKDRLIDGERELGVKERQIDN